jgi:hypothetical protein
MVGLIVFPDCVDTAESFAEDALLLELVAVEVETVGATFCVDVVQLDVQAGTAVDFACPNEWMLSAETATSVMLSLQIILYPPGYSALTFRTRNRLPLHVPLQSSAGQSLA